MTTYEKIKKAIGIYGRVESHVSQAGHIWVNTHPDNFGLIKKLLGAEAIGEVYNRADGGIRIEIHEYAIEL